MMWPLNPRVIVLAAGIALACAASSSIGYKLGRASGDKDVRKMLEAGQKALADRDRKIERSLNEYRDELTAVSNRPPRRVFFCPPGNVPPAAGGTPGAGGSAVDRQPDGTDIGGNKDYGPELRAARDALLRCNALIEVVK